MRNEFHVYSNLMEIEVNTRDKKFHVLVDRDDQELVSSVDRWVIFKDRQGNPKVRSGQESGQVFLHRLLMPDLPPRATVGFKNGNEMDYRRSNLQAVQGDQVTDFIDEEPEDLEETPAAEPVEEETQLDAALEVFTPEELEVHIKEEQPPAEPEVHPATPEPEPEEEPEKSQVRGVYRHKQAKKWHASAFWEGKRYSLGYFDVMKDAEAEVALFREHGPEHPGLRRNSK